MSTTENRESPIDVTIRAAGELYKAGIVPFDAFDRGITPLIRLKSRTSPSAIGALNRAAEVVSERRGAGLLSPDLAAELQAGIDNQLSDVAAVSSATNKPDIEKLRQKELLPEPLLRGVDFVTRGQNLPRELQTQLTGELTPVSDEVSMAVMGLPVSVEAISSLLVPLRAPTIRLPLELSTTDIAIATRVMANLAGEDVINADQANMWLSALVTQFNPQGVWESEQAQLRSAARVRATRRSWALGSAVGFTIAAIEGMFEYGPASILNPYEATFLLSSLIIMGAAYLWDDRRKHMRNINKRLSSTRRYLLKSPTV